MEKSAAERVREEDFDRALPEEEQVTALLERAYRARRVGDTALAVSLCQEALRLRPDSTTPHSLLGQIYEGLGERDLAIHAYERVLQLNPGSIADRVKLDELRGGNLPVTHGVAPPHILITDRKPWRPNAMTYTTAGIGLVLGLLAGVGVLGLFANHIGHTPKEDTLRPDTSARNRRMAARAEPNTSTNGASTNGVTPADRQTSTPPTGSDVELSRTRVAAAPNTGFPAPVYSPYPWSMPPTIIYERPAETHTRYVPVPANLNNTAPPTLAPVRPPASARPNANRNGRIVLPPDDAADEKGTMVIQVGTNRGKTKSAPDTSGTGSRIAITVGPHPVGGDTSQSVGYDARLYIAAGDEHRQNGEYDKAIQSYTRALPAAGDDLAFVYQQIARCHQLRGDKTSAITNYKSAITEYHKLIDAKKQVEFAESGVKVCETGIKACNY
jgi:tetratricopeptide (TPR) repeat protein